LQEGVKANIVEKSAVGFWVVFSPQTITVERFGYTRDARL
jgi:hypothetical protein